MEYIVEKIGMSRTVDLKSTPVTLLKLINTKICEVGEDGKAIVAYAKGKADNKAIGGIQKKYGLSKEFNKFATLCLGNVELGDQSLDVLSSAKIIKVSFVSKGKAIKALSKDTASRAVRNHTEVDFTEDRARSATANGRDASSRE